MKKGLLPIGTVVRLEGGSKKLMITGYYLSLIHISEPTRP